MSFPNKRKAAFLKSFPKASIESERDTIASKCKFNFSYFVRDQEAAQDFKDWTTEQLIKLLDKLVSYTSEPLSYWESQKIGKGKGHVLEIYGNFPRKSDMSHPKSVPHQAQWGRFRLESSVRLIGFKIPDTYHLKEQNRSGYHFCKNTFYVVFLDKDHRFYRNK